MLKWTAHLALAAILTVGLLPQAASAQRSGRNLEVLGTATIGTRIERDVIEIGPREGRFQSIEFEVKQSDVEIIDLKIVYGGGQADEYRVRELFRAGSRSRSIDLKGRDRVIRQIEVTYRARGPVQIVFYGEQGRFVDNDRGWEQLGCQKVGFIADRDIIRVGRRDGRFRSIKLKVSDNRIRMVDLRVVYGSGIPDTIPVRSVIPAGAEVGPFDLKGDKRFIDRIELIYLSQFNFKGQATVCAYGRP
ncbi:MAG: hypothetical protein ACT4N2_15660 [Hyphomicrobium sp.]